MASRALEIVTKDAIINSRFTLILKHDKYLPPDNIINEYPRAHVLKVTYRRLMRLRPFVSERQMVRDTFTEYLRYKFKTENYQMKRIASGMACDTDEPDDLESIMNSLRFILKAVTHMKKSINDDGNLSRDNILCGKILKNILTLEYEKQRLINKNPAIYHSQFRKTYDYLKGSDEKNMLKFVAVREFDMCLIGLNEMLQTRL